MNPRSVRVLYLITELGFGGAERVVQGVAQSLARRGGYEVSAACLFHPGPVAQELEANGVDVFDLGMRSKLDVSAVLRLGSLLNQLRPDVLHSHLFHANVMARVVGRWRKVPIVVTSEHNMEVESGLRRTINRLTSPLSSQVVACSAPVADFTVNRIGIRRDKVAVVTNGVDTRWFSRKATDNTIPRSQEMELGLVPGSPLLVTVAGLRPEKALQNLVEAVALLRRDGRGVSAAIIGEGTQRAEIQGRIDDLALGESVHLLGQLDDPRPVLKKADIFVLPSSAEGLPIALLEAMAMELPSVVTDVGGIRRAIEDGVTGVLVEPSSPKALAEAIGALLDNEELRRSMGRRARERVELEFSIDAMVEDTIDLYERLLSEDVSD